MDKLILPAIANTHSHAFQRAMAGLTEYRSASQDSFWTWRELMYRFASQITPEQLYAIAAQLYGEMLEAGFTHVCEFHYLHHQPNGQPYDNPAEMSLAIIRAAEDAGIGLTLLPVLYQTGGFDGRALQDTQKRFEHSTDAFLDLIASLQKHESHLLKIGVALHSLRAVPEHTLQEVLPILASKKMPVHIHIAEQLSEVNECLEIRGARPVQWLLDNADVNEYWCLVHATHMDSKETKAFAKTNAVVSICTTTEANLGDGFFPFKEYIKQKGRWSVGTDSNASVSLVEELRWLEYGQRLKHQQRNITVSDKQTSVALSLHDGAAAGGWQASGVEARDDYIELDQNAPALFHNQPEDLANRFIFAGNRPLIRSVKSLGLIRVEEGQHVFRRPFEAAYKLALGQLLA
ncbi:MAG: formimidoylglutamate deiminase [Arenimonas sp.]|nr:formimidoylglutamate deiminase [Arenimonas sp.]